MSDVEILKPVMVLMAWTMVMWVWMYATRIPAFNKLPKSNNPNDDVGWTAARVETTLPPNVQWKAHNYNHLHEAPTLFYAVGLTLAIIGQGDGLNAQLAWLYVALRVLHSLVQAITNRVIVRFMLFALSSLVLIALILHAAMSVFGWH